MKIQGDFRSLGLNQELTDKLAQKEITVPTEVQEQAIPAVLEGRTLMVQSPTGTGKTLAYLAPLLARTDLSNRDLEFLILVPSRELALQVVNLAKELAGNIPVVSLIGGANSSRQLEALKEKPKLAVGTPGRILETMKKGKINGQAIKTIVVDEADKMLTAGFLDDVKGILKGTLKTRQVLLFSATIPKELLELGSGLIQEPEVIRVGEGAVPPTIQHQYLMCQNTQRTQSVVKLLEILKPQKAIIFIQRNEGVGPLAGRLQELGLDVAALHSDLIQSHRREVLQKFRQGKVSILITTDLLARGMDIEGVEYIFNYDLPSDPKHYLHRVGRTGRGGKAGTAVTLVSEEQKFIITKFAKALKIPFIQIGLDQDRVFPVIYTRTTARKRGQ